MLFIPNDEALAAQAVAIFEKVVAAEGHFRIAGWREVPVDHSLVGRMAAATQPIIRQVFIEHTGGAVGAALERDLFIVRKLVERERAALGDAAEDFYVCSLSNRTIVYKVSSVHTPGLRLALKWHPPTQPPTLHGLVGEGIQLPSSLVISRCLGV